jgi:hypothetical protein
MWGNFWHKYVDDKTTTNIQQSKMGVLLKYSHLVQVLKYSHLVQGYQQNYLDALIWYSFAH